MCGRRVPVFYPLVAGDCAGDVDGTGMAVQALVAAGAEGDSEPAVAWLLDCQRDDGSFSSSGPGAIPNSNSTALAAQALMAAGEPDAAARAVDWLLTRQVACAGPVADRGAIGYAEPVADGAAPRATAQALPAIAWRRLDDLDLTVQQAGADPPPSPCGVTPTGSGTTTATAAPTATSTAGPSTTSPSAAGVRPMARPTPPRCATPLRREALCRRPTRGRRPARRP